MCGGRREGSGSHLRLGTLHSAGHGALLLATLLRVEHSSHQIGGDVAHSATAHGGDNFGGRFALGVVGPAAAAAVQGTTADSGHPGDGVLVAEVEGADYGQPAPEQLSLIHISEPTRRTPIS